MNEDKISHEKGFLGTKDAKPPNLSVFTSARVRTYPSWMPSMSFVTFNGAPSIFYSNESSNADQVSMKTLPAGRFSTFPLEALGAEAFNEKNEGLCDVAFKDMKVLLECLTPGPGRV